MASKKDPGANLLAERTQGSVRVLRKPLDPEELVRAVRQLVRPRSSLLI